MQYILPCKYVSVFPKVSPTSCAVLRVIYLIRCTAKCIRTWTSPFVTTSLLRLTTRTWQETSCCPSPEWRCTRGCCRMVADVLKVYFSSDLLVVRSMMDISFEHKATGKLKALINFTSKLLFSSILNGNFSVGNDHSAKLPRHPCFLLPAAPLLRFSQPVQVFHFPFRVYMNHFLLHKPHWGKGQRRVWGPAVLLCSSSGWRFLLPRSDS